jgi:ATP-dependent DNA helicase DinG
MADMPEIKDYIDPAVISYMRDAIAEAGGNEVFFLCACGDDRRVTRAQVIARGDDESVPALTQDAAVGDVVAHNHPSGLLSPSKPDIEIASTLGSRGVGFFIVNNQLTEIYAVVEPFTKEVIKPIEEAEVEAALSGGGALSKTLERYEVRPGQIQMAHEVVRAFNEDKVAAFEGGTGVGKSMAYLVPSLHWVLKNRERVVISTNTINLQEQLIGKDVPLLGRALSGQFKAVLVKGRGNYLCLRKLDLALSEGDFMLEDQEKEGLAAIAAWAGNTKEGSRSDLNFMPDDGLWEKISSESDTCMRLKCKHFAHCFFFRARREAASADLLVVNHHILLADIALRSATGGGSEMAILPGYSRLVIDEGHNLEDGATSYFGSRVSRLGMLKMLGRLHHRKERDRGTLPLIVSRLRGKGAPSEKAEAWRLLIDGKLLSEKESVAARVGEAFDALYLFLLDGKAEGEAPELKLRITDLVRGSKRWAGVEDAFGRLGVELARLVRSLNSLHKELVDDGFGDRLADPLVELKSMSERLEGVGAELDMLLKGGGDGLVRWVEAPARKAGRVIALCGSPLNVAREIKERIYDRLKTVVITSATLTVKKRFDFIARRIGLDLLGEGRLVTGVFPSPFDYARQVVIGIPRDIPEPTDGGFPRVLTELVRESLEVSRGHAFVLFTSFKMLDKVYRELELDMASMGIKGLKHGAAPRHKLLEDFRKFPSAALFGTDSFWEGVDVEGDSLSNVIITKLPFSVPDDPVIEARQEEIAAMGGNPFMEYTVPQAVIKFRQGFGRLIRSKRDRGCIMVFDKRIIDKNYGREFIDSLPGCRVVTGNRETIFERVLEFFTPEMA